MILILASHKEDVFQAAKFQNTTLGGLPTLFDIRNTPSASLLEAYKKAKEAATGPNKQMTVIGVDLVDVSYQDLIRKDKWMADQWTSFARTFVIAVGEEGGVLWETLGEGGPPLDEYIQRRGSLIYPWEIADEFVKDFEILALSEVSTRITDLNSFETNLEIGRKLGFYSADVLQKNASALMLRSIMVLG